MFSIFPMRFKKMLAAAQWRKFLSPAKDTRGEESIKLCFLCSLCGLKKNARSGPGGDLWVIELLFTKIVLLFQTDDILLN